MPKVQGPTAHLFLFIVPFNGALLNETLFYDSHRFFIYQFLYFSTPQTHWIYREVMILHCSFRFKYSILFL